MVPWMRDKISYLYLLKIMSLFPLILSCFIALSLTGCHSVGVLDPKGIIAYEERKLLFDTFALMLIVVLPVIIMSLVFVYHYQVSHRVRDYKPNWGHSLFLESLWWGIPCVIIAILAVLTWKKTHLLDPYNPISGTNAPPMLIQAIALPWKWLFIYPEQNIATVNYLVVPAGRQIEYYLTTDNVPMSAFFIPQLGSQIYAMAGMKTRLHLLSNTPGIYEGLNTQYNGNGFSDMHFPVRVVLPNEMDAWINEVKKTSYPLTDDAYLKLLSPSIQDKPIFFSSVVKNDFFDNVVDIYNHTYGTTHPRENIGFSHVNN